MFFSKFYGGIMKKVIILSLLFSLTVFAKDIYVKAGSNGDGTKEKPYGTVEDALKDVFSFDVIHVAKGDYFGPGGSGLFVIEKPDITMVGGYNDDFSQRNPFKNITRLLRGASEDPSDCLKSPRCKEIIERQKIPVTKASYNAGAIVQGQSDHKNFVIDGFVIDGYTRNSYKTNDDLSLAKGPVGTPCMSFSKPGVKIRNVVVINCAGSAISMNALGVKLDAKDKRESGDDWNDIVNTLVINTVMKSIDFQIGDMTESKPDNGAAMIKNTTMAFNWPRLGEDYNILQGRQTRLTIKDSILSFAGFGINNGFGNDKARLIGNVFYGHTSGSYRYMERANSTLILDDVTELTDKKCDKKYFCSKQSKDNTSKDPKYKNVDKFFIERFFNQIEGTEGGKVTMDTMNQMRSFYGVNLQGSAGSGKVNYAPIWDPGKNWENILLMSDEVSGKGVQFDGIDGKFETYKSKDVVKVEKTYKEFKYDDVKRTANGLKEVASKGDLGMDIAVPFKVGDRQMTAYYLPETAGVKKEDGWECYYDKTRIIYLYVKRGTEVYDAFKQAEKDSAEVIMKGTAYVFFNDKIGMKIDEVEGNDED